MSVATSFARLIPKLELTERERLAAQIHIGSVRTRLSSSFSMSKVFIGGSHSRNTSIRGISDVDIFAVVTRKEATWGDRYSTSVTMLNRMRDDLTKRFPNTEVSRDVHAIVVPFSSGPSVDVVPAIFAKMLNNRPAYLIPDGGGGWMLTSPDSHHLYLQNANERSLGKLKRVAQLLKYWRQCSSTRLALSSFHIELLLASQNICTGAKTYPVCVTEALQTLADRGCCALQDPLGISGRVPAAATERQQGDLLSSVKYALRHARDACIADCGGNHKEAWRQWSIVFNNKFPI